MYLLKSAEDMDSQFRKNAATTCIQPWYMKNPIQLVLFLVNGHGSQCIFLHSWWFLVSCSPPPGVLRGVQGSKNLQWGTSVRRTKGSQNLCLDNFGHTNCFVKCGVSETWAPRQAWQIRKGLGVKTYEMPMALQRQRSWLWNLTCVESNSCSTLALHSSFTAFLGSCLRYTHFTLSHLAAAVWAENCTLWNYKENWT